MPAVIVAPRLKIFSMQNGTAGARALWRTGGAAPGGRGQDAPARSSPRLRPEAGGEREPHSGYALS